MTDTTNEKEKINNLIKQHHEITSTICNGIIEGIQDILEKQDTHKLKLIYEECKYYIEMIPSNFTLKEPVDKIVKLHYDITSSICYHLVEGMDKVMSKGDYSKLKLAYEESQLYLYQISTQFNLEENKND